MKLLRVGAKGLEKPAILHTDGTYRDLSAIVPELRGLVLTPEGLSRIRAVDPASLPILDRNQRIGPCVDRVGKFICVGLNYADHAAESNMQVPPEPVLFMKATSAIIGPNDDVIVPKNSTKCDWEVELGIVIGKEARYVDEANALDHVAGYCVVNDISERAFHSLEAPVIRVGGFHMPYPVAKVEEDYLPDIDRILEALDRALSY